MKADDVQNILNKGVADANSTEDSAWAALRDQNTVEWDKIRCQIVLQFCIDCRKALLALSNNLGQVQSQYEMQLRQTGGRIQV